MTRLVLPVLWCVAVFLAAPALAQPPAPPAPPPVLPAPVPPPSQLLAPLAQDGSAAGIAGLPPQIAGPGELMLGQHAVPSLPGTGPTAPPHLNAFNNQYLLPQNLVPAAPGEGTVFGVEPGQENADVRSIDYLRRLWEMYQAGGLEGGLLGQRPVEELNKPLPVEPPAVPPVPGA